MNRRCQGLHPCKCYPADVAVTRLDLREPTAPPVTEDLCRACLAALERDPSFRIVLVEEYHVG